MRNWEERLEMALLAVTCECEAWASGEQDPVATLRRIRRLIAPITGEALKKAGLELPIDQRTAERCASCKALAGEHVLGCVFGPLSPNRG